MRKSRSWALGVALVIAVALLVVPAIVLAGRDSSTTVRVDPKGAGASPAAEDVRADRRDSFRHRGCAKRPEAFMASV